MLNEQNVGNECGPAGTRRDRPGRGDRSIYLLLPLLLRFTVMRLLKSVENCERMRNEWVCALKSFRFWVLLGEWTSMCFECLSLARFTSFVDVQCRCLLNLGEEMGQISLAQYDGSGLAKKSVCCWIEAA